MFLDRARELADKVRAEGVRATYDSREAANPPVVLIGPPTITPRNACVGDYAWPIYCLAPGGASTDADTLAVLDPLVDAVFAAGCSGPVRPVTYPSAAGDLPGFQIDYAETM